MEMIHLKILQNSLPPNLPILTPSFASMSTATASAPPSIEELTSISGVELNCLVVTAQVRGSLRQPNIGLELISASMSMALSYSTRSASLVPPKVPLSHITPWRCSGVCTRRGPIKNLLNVMENEVLHGGSRSSPLFGGPSKLVTGGKCLN